MTENEHEDGWTVWIKTEQDFERGSYVTTVEVTDDIAINITPELAPKWAHTVLSAVARAEYDAAVMRQLSEKLKLEQDVAGQMVSDMRQDRPPIENAMEPLGLVPGVNAKFEPFLHVQLNGTTVGQWTIPDARSHALHLLESLIVADLDTVYYKTLLGLVQVEPHVAANVVDDLQHWR